MPLPRAPPGLETSTFEDAHALRQAAAAVAAERSRVEASRLGHVEEKFGKYFG